MKRLPEHGMCFVCGSENEHGIGVTWYAEEDGTIFSRFTLTEAQQGPPGHAHGGASAAILDEAMGAAVWRAGYNVAVINLDIRYKKPLPLHQTLTLRARLGRRYRDKIFATGEIYLPDGTVAVTGRGVYKEAPQLFEPTRFRDTEG